MPPASPDKARTGWHGDVATPLGGRHTWVCKLSSQTKKIVSTRETEQDEALA